MRNMLPVRGLVGVGAARGRVLRASVAMLLALAGSGCSARRAGRPAEAGAAPAAVAPVPAVPVPAVPAPAARAPVSRALEEAMLGLQQATARLGAPSASEGVLRFGTTAVNDDFSLVDAITRQFGCTATLFVAQGADFVRVSTDVMVDGRRAVGTKLNPQGPVIGRLKQGQTFAGVVTILGEWYETIYAPMLDAGGKVVGAHYVGFKVGARLRKAITQLEAQATRLGAPSASEGVLRFGATAVNDDFSLVDAITREFGCTATLFVAQGADFVRVSTDVMVDGKRAVGTKLNPQGPVIGLVRAGKAFAGGVDILGSRYETIYEPILDAQGRTVGVYYVGFKVAE
ncbi:MAG: Cache 3/Cache 2 fusion domain-containing protein [Planctomycetia bacterium]